jgi:hypothetical protein
VQSGRNTGELARGPARWASRLGLAARKERRRTEVTLVKIEVKKVEKIQATEYKDS